MEVAKTVTNIVLGMSPWVPKQRRYGVDSFTPQELTAAIATGTPDAQIARFSVTAPTSSTAKSTTGKQR